MRCRQAEWWGATIATNLSAGAIIRRTPRCEKTKTEACILNKRETGREAGRVKSRRVFPDGPGLGPVGPPSSSRRLHAGRLVGRFACLALNLAAPRTSSAVQGLMASLISGRHCAPGAILYSRHPYSSRKDLILDRHQERMHSPLLVEESRLAPCLCHSASRHQGPALMFFCRPTFVSREHSQSRPRGGSVE